MAQCDMCGKSVDRLTLGIIEKVELNVCPDCLKLGKRKPTPRPLKQSFNSYNSSSRPEQRVIINSGNLIKSAREKLGMRQQDLAKMLQIKDSFLHHIEIGDMPLRLKLAKKFEETLSITLIKEVKSISVAPDEVKSTGMTLGDLIKFKK